MLNENKYVINDAAITKWTIDLDTTGILVKWDKICTKLLVIRNPKLQDFGRPFLHRSYYLNVQVAGFIPDVSPKCTFCKTVDETLIHLYWQCKHVKSLWSKVQTFVVENISEEESMNAYSCLLTDFDCHVLVLISVIVKYRIFLARLNQWKPSYVQVLKDLRW